MTASVLHRRWRSAVARRRIGHLGDFRPLGLAVLALGDLVALEAHEIQHLHAVRSDRRICDGMVRKYMNQARHSAITAPCKGQWRLGTYEAQDQFAARAIS
jgi:hypothetical protein